MSWVSSSPISFKSFLMDILKVLLKDTTLSREDDIQDIHLVPRLNGWMGGGTIFTVMTTQ
ncbi:unnamed protein product, partial [Boreogadus saida]